VLHAVAEFNAALNQESGPTCSCVKHCAGCLSGCTRVQGGTSPGYQGKGTKADLDNHAKQLNPNNALFSPKGGAAADESTAGGGKK